MKNDRRLTFRPLLALTALLQACGPADPPPNTCVPGQSIECHCSNGKVGAQTCNGEGTYDACTCTDVAPAAAGTPSGAKPASSGGENGDGAGSRNGTDATNSGSSPTATGNSGAGSGTERRPLGSLQAVAAGSAFTCALTTAGGVKCWGSNDKGRLGNRTTADSLLPVDVFGLSANVLQIGLSSRACALLSSGTVQCWGNNYEGKLGDGTDADRNYPVDVPGISQADAISVAESGGCAHLTTGGIRCWGAFGYTAPIATGTASIAVGGSGYSSSLTSGEFLCIVLTDTGTAQCAGSSLNGQLGSGDIYRAGGVYHRSSFKNVIGLESGVLSIAAGANFACALTDGGQVLCWGDNSAQQLGGGSSSDESLSPVLVNGLESIVQISAFGANACALQDGGRVFCWGANESSQIGNGTQSESVSMPAEVTGIDSAVQVTVGGNHACVLLTDGTARCWGGGGYGQLGDGRTNVQPTPVAVLGG